MKRKHLFASAWHRTVLTCTAVLVGAGLLIVGCSQPAPAAAPTQAPAKAAEPTKAPAQTKAAAPTSAPTAQAAAPARASDFPAKGKPITLIVPLAAGSGTDIASRVMAVGLEKELGTSVQVVNKPGSSTIVGMTELARSKPDGYTLATTVFMTVIGSYLDPELKATYTRKDFQPVAHYMRERNVLVVKGDSPYKTLKELVDAAKANPGKVKFGGSGILGNPHVAMLMLEQAAKVQFAPVQYPGAGDAVTALLGGHVDFVVTGGSTTLSHWKNGAVRVLGITDKEENEYYPGVKTLQAQGYDVVAPFSTGISAPAGTPKEIVGVLSDAIGKAFQTEEFQNRVRQAGLTPDYMPTDAFAAYWEELEPRVKPIISLARQERK